MDFEKICMMFTMQEPFYGILLSAMNRVSTTKIPTMGVGRSGNVFRLYYNPDYTERHSVDTILQALKHEVLHVAFNHFDLWDEDHPTKDIQFLRNVAADMEVNSYIDRNVLDADCKWVFADDRGWENRLGTREYYKRLLQEAQQKQQQPQQAQAQQPQKPCNGGLGGMSASSQQQNQTQQNQQSQSNPGQTQPQPQNGQQPSQQQSSQPQPQPSNGISQDYLDQFDQFDDHSDWPDSADEMQETREMVDALLAFAADECEKGRGTIPGELTGRIERIKKKPKPVTDWKRYFRRYLGNEFTEFIRKSKKRESRRFPDAAGNRHRRKSHILVGIDTSGSVCMPEYKEFFGQIKTLYQQASFHVLECDTRIQHEYDFKGIIPEVLHGHGGTEFQPVIDYFLEHRKNYDMLVYFTDGYCDIPKNTPRETLWVISSDGDKNRQKYKRNGASVVFIPKKN